MPVNLADFPDQPVKAGGGVDLSAFPDQPTQTPSVNLSDFPDRSEDTIPIGPPQLVAPTSDLELGGALFKGIAGGAKDAFDRFIDRSQPTPPSIAADPLAGKDQNFIGQIRDIPLETAFPQFAGARKGDIPIVSDIFPQTKGVVPPAVRPFTTGVGTAFDVIVDVAKAIPAVLDHTFGPKDQTFGTRIKRAISRNDDFLADRLIRSDADMMQEQVDKAIASGVDPKLVKAGLMTRFTLLGMAMDIAEGFAFEAALRAPGRLSAALRKEARALNPKSGTFAVRARQLEKRAIEQKLAQANAEEVARFEEALKPFRGQIDAKVFDQPFTPIDRSTGKAAQATLKQARKDIPPPKQPKTALPKAKKKNIIERAAAREQERLQQALAPSAEQEIGRGVRKDRPFTPFDKSLGKAAQQTLEETRQGKLGPKLTGRTSLQGNDATREGVSWWVA
jgi:hypothetical protein